MPRAQCWVSIQHEFRNERPSSIASALSSILGTISISMPSAAARSLRVLPSPPQSVTPKIMRTEVASIRKAALELLLLEDIAVVRDLLARVFVIVNQPMTYPVGLMKPN